MTHSRTSILVLQFAPWIIMVAGVMILFLLYQQNLNSYTIKQNNAYTRVSNCILGKSAYQQIKQSDVEKCYKTVENDSHIKLKRFDYQTDPQPVNN